MLSTCPFPSRRVVSFGRSWTSFGAIVALVGCGPPGDTDPAPGDDDAPPIAGTPLPDGTVHGMWVWAEWDADCRTPSGAICYAGETDCARPDDSPCEALDTVWFDADRGRALVSAAEHNDVSPLYTSTYYPRSRTITVGDDTWEALLYRDAELRLVADAQDRGIDVWAMASFGSGDIDFTGFHEGHAGGTSCDPEAVNEPLHRVLDVIRLGASDAGFAFDGLYIDLEPDIDGLASDESSLEDDVANLRGVLDVLSCAKALVGDADLDLATTVSWRWDATFDYQDTTASMAAHLYGLALDHYVVVPYHRRVDVLVARAEPFVSAASDAGIVDRVAVAAETQDCSKVAVCNDETTFFPCGHWGYVSVLRDVVGRFGGARGVVTHAYGQSYLSGARDWPAEAVLEGDWPNKPEGCDPDL